MLTPRCIFSDDFRQFYDYFLSQPHSKKKFHKGDCLWKPGQPYETIHQEYHSSLVKICNLLYLLTADQTSGLSVDMTQNELSEILGLSRVQLTRGLSELRKRTIISTTRGKICITNLPELAKLCSSEIF